MTNAPKTVLAIHDLPGFGRAALSVIVPVLSTLGVQTVALPTAVLSTHTGGLGTPAKLANPGYGPAALEHYHRLGVKFDCIYSGYLADAAQAKLVEQAFELWPRAFKVVDPVLGDGGRLYSGLGADMVPAMYSLCSKADLIVPNVTEAALLLGDPLPGVGSAEQAAAQAARLTRVAPQVVVTGVTGIGGGRYIGCVGAARGGEGYAVKTPLQPRMFHGTGDIFCRRARRAHFAGQRPPGCRTGSCRLRSRVHQADARGSRRAAGRLAGERPAETAAGVKSRALRSRERTRGVGDAAPYNAAAAVRQPEDWPPYTAGADPHPPPSPKGGLKL